MTAGSNCVPALRRSSSIASAIGGPAVGAVGRDRAERVAGRDDARDHGDLVAFRPSG